MRRLAAMVTVFVAILLCLPEAHARQADGTLRARMRTPQAQRVAQPLHSQQQTQQLRRQQGPNAQREVPTGVRVPAWKDFDERKRADLASFADRWDRLPASRRVQILERYDRFQSLPAAKQNALREGAINFQQMSPQQRQKMRDSLQTLRTLPPDQQRALRQQWQAMSPEQRRAWLDAGGPGIAQPPKP